MWRFWKKFGDPCLNRYFINFVRFNFNRVLIIVETGLTKYFCLVNFKGFCPLCSRVLKSLPGKRAVAALGANQGCKLNKFLIKFKIVFTKNSQNRVLLFQFFKFKFVNFLSNLNLAKYYVFIISLGSIDVRIEGNNSGVKPLFEEYTQTTKKIRA